MTPRCWLYSFHDTGEFSILWFARPAGCAPVSWGVSPLPPPSCATVTDNQGKWFGLIRYDMVWYGLEGFGKSLLWFGRLWFGMLYGKVRFYFFLSSCLWSSTSTILDATAGFGMVRHSCEEINVGQHAISNLLLYLPEFCVFRIF